METLYAVCEVIVVSAMDVVEYESESLLETERLERRTTAAEKCVVDENGLDIKPLLKTDSARHDKNGNGSLQPMFIVSDQQQDGDTFAVNGPTASESSCIPDAVENASENLSQSVASRDKCAVSTTERVNAECAEESSENSAEFSSLPNPVDNDADAAILRETLESSLEIPGDVKADDTLDEFFVNCDEQAHVVSDVQMSNADVYSSVLSSAMMHSSTESNEATPRNVQNVTSTASAQHEDVAKGMYDMCVCFRWFFYIIF